MAIWLLRQPYFSPAPSSIFRFENLETEPVKRRTAYGGMRPRVLWRDYRWIGSFSYGPAITVTATVGELPIVYVPEVGSKTTYENEVPSVPALKLPEDVEVPFPLGMTA